MNFKTLLSLLMLAALFVFVGCEDSDERDDEEEGEMVGNFELVEEGEREEGDQYSFYEGEETVSGTYEYNADNIFLGLFLELDEDSVELVPQGELSNGRIGFINWEEAYEALGLDDLDTESCALYEGVVTVKIEDYQIALAETAGAIDLVNLVEVVESDGPTPMCEENEEVEETSSGFTLVEADANFEEDGAYYAADVYEGTATISGTYNYNAEGVFFKLSFQVDGDSQDLLPESNLDNGYLSFRNYDEALEMFGIAGMETEVCPMYKGSVTIKIQDYWATTITEGESRDSVVLLEVIENDGPSADCLQEL